MNLSIIIPTYNRSNMLKIVLDDILKQKDVNDYEVLVIDDNSTDKTKDLVMNYHKQYPHIKYFKNTGNGQRDGKKTWIEMAKWEYITFFDDDIEIPDPLFLKKIYNKLDPNIVLQSKIIMFNLDQKEYKEEYKWNKYFNKPFPILELFKFKMNYWNTELLVFPMIECGNFFHNSLKEHFVDHNLIKDWRGESYSSSIKILQAWKKIIFSPNTVIHHIWCTQWWSKKFNKKSLKYGFSEFHFGYFYNVTYLHTKYKKNYIFIRLPFYILKGILSLLINKDIKGFKKNCASPIYLSLKKHYKLRS